MDIKQFATKYRLRLKQDGCGDWIVLGRLTDKETAAVVKKRMERVGVKRVIAEYHGHVYDGFADGKLGVYLGFVSARKYGNARRALLAVGCEGKQAAGTDGCLKFDPTDEQQVRAVIKLGGLKVRRTLSEATLDRLRQRLIPIRRPVERTLAV